MGRFGGADERGSVAITVALALTVLLAFAALVVDVGLNWAARAGAQTAADAAALAGAAKLPDGPAAVATVRQFLNVNATGLADRPSDANWPFNGTDDDGEVVCWTLPGVAPGPGAGCPAGANALQVTTPPVPVDYAFASVFGARSNPIKALAAAGAGPGAPSNCALCLLDPAAVGALSLTDAGDVVVSGGALMVNSAAPWAVVLSGTGAVQAEQLGIAGGYQGPGSLLVPPPALGAAPVADPLAALPTPDALPSPPACCSGEVEVGDQDRQIEPGVYDSIELSGAGDLTLRPGVYVLRRRRGLRITGSGSVLGSGVTVYLACDDYPEPCDGQGAGLLVQASGRYLAVPAAGGPYAGLALFADRGNTAPLRFVGDGGGELPGAVYAAAAQLRLASDADLRLDSLLVLGRLLVGGPGSVTVAHDLGGTVPVPARPVLIR